jgi:phosphohistidine phosphatase
MQRLILLRHAEAERRSRSGDDFDRGLTPEGRAEAQAIGKRLAAKGIKPDLVIVSTAKRAGETWAEVEAVFPEALVAAEPDLYEASPATLLQVAEAAKVDGAVMLVAHNPGLHALAVGLGGDGPLKHGLPTAHAAVFSFDADGAPRFEGVVKP